jgi:putative glutathione S-transferase
MFQTPGIGEAINMRHIKTGYFTSHPKLNTYAIVPVGTLTVPVVLEAGELN